MKAGGKGREPFNVTHFAARFAAAEVSHESEARREARGGATAWEQVQKKRGDERNDGLVTFPMLERMQIAHCPLPTGLGGSGLARLVLCFAG